MHILVLLLLMLIALPLQAQQINLQQVTSRLSSLAEETIDMDLDGAMLSFASKFLSDDNAKRGLGRNEDEVAARKLIEGLKSIHIRVFQFDREGKYTAGDLQPLRDQLKAPQWTRFIGMNKKEEKIEVWMSREGENPSGLFLISEEANELVIVNIVGPIRPEDLGAIGGRLGIPKFKMPKFKEEQQ